MLGEYARFNDDPCIFCDFKKIKSSDGFYKEKVNLHIPKAKPTRPVKFLHAVRSLLINDEIYFLGGKGGKIADGRKIAKLTDCRIRETKYRLNFYYTRSVSSVVSFIKDGKSLGRNSKE